MGCVFATASAETRSEFFFLFFFLVIVLIALFSPLLGEAGDVPAAHDGRSLASSQSLFGSHGRAMTTQRRDDVG